MPACCIEKRPARLDVQNLFKLGDGFIDWQTALCVQKSR